MSTFFQTLKSFFLLITTALIFGAHAACAMPHRDGLPEPDFPIGVNQPDRELPARDDTDLEGEWQCLIILVDFPDYPWDNQDDTLFNNDGNVYTTEHFRDMLFSEGEYAHPGSRSEYTGSMRDYFSEVSGGFFTVDGLVTVWYRAPENYRYYVNNDGEAGTDDDHGFGEYPNNVQRLVEDAIEAADEDVDFSRFDNDNDGMVDALFLVHAGPGAEALPEREGVNYIWSHKWNINPNERDRVFISGYTFEPQDGTIGVFCHEFGHALGLPDLYDTDYSTEGIGEWGLMGGGGWTHRAGDPLGTSPSHMCAWSKMQLEWVEVVNVEGRMQGVEIAPVIESGTVYRLWRDGEAGEEYFLVENRRRIGFDEGLTRRQIINELPAPEGLLVLHIDDGQRRNDDELHRLVDVEEASPVLVDGEWVENLDLPHERIGDDLRLVNRGDNGDLWPGFTELNEEFTDWVGERRRDRFDTFTIPSSVAYDRQPSMVHITNIRLEGENVICDLSVTGGDAILLFPDEIVTDDREGGNGDGYIEPGEVIDLTIRLENFGRQAANRISAVLAYDGEWADVLDGEAAYPDIPAGAVRGPEAPFVFSVNPDAPPVGQLNFLLTVDFNDTSRTEIPIVLDIRSAGEWFKWPGNPVLVGEEGAWDEVIVSPAVVVEDTLIHCWYIGGPMDEGDMTPPAVGYAWSSDGGATWHRGDEPVLSPNPDVEWMAGGFVTVGVAKYDDLYVMAVGAQDAEDIGSVARAISDDGINWQLAQAPFIVGGQGWVNEVLNFGQIDVFDAGDMVGCAFTTGDADGMTAIGAAFSFDLNRWQIEPEPALIPSRDSSRFDAFATFAPAIWVDGQEIELYYSGLTYDFISRVGKGIVDLNTRRVRRYDGSEDFAAVLVPGGRGAWDQEAAILSARPFKWNGEKRLLYTAYSEEMPQAAVCLATAMPHQVAVSHKPEQKILPQLVRLEGSYPNPFNNTTTIRFSLRTSSTAAISIHDLMGREVARIGGERMSAGSHSLVWDGYTKQGKPAASGLYLVRVTVDGGRSAVGRLVLTK